MRACLGCRRRPADRSPLAVPIVRCGRCRRAHCTRPCARVGVMSSDFDDGGMLYYDRVGQGRKKSGLVCVFAPGSREKHGRVRSVTVTELNRRSNEPITRQTPYKDALR